MLFLNDNTHVLKTYVKDKTIDLVITSPPYKDVDGYTEDLMYRVFTECFRVAKKNSLFFLNFGHLAEDKWRPFRVCQIAMECGWQLNETITWVKNHYRPIQGHKRLNNLTEFIFMLYKGRMPKLDRLAIGVPYKDKSNVTRWKGANKKDVKCGGNIWYIPYDTIQDKADKTHNDRFPLELPTRCIKLSGLKTGRVLDPFMGSGTTCVAAKMLGFNILGIERNQVHYDKAVKLVDRVPTRV